MKKIVDWYKGKNKFIRIIIWVAIVFLLLFSNLQSNKFMVTQLKNDTPENAIRSEVLKNWGENGHIYQCLYKSFVLEVGEVSEEEAIAWYDNGYDDKTQKIYRITKNCPNMFGGYWIVTKVHHNGESYYTARYGGI